MEDLFRSNKIEFNYENQRLLDPELTNKCKDFLNEFDKIAHLREDEWRTAASPIYSGLNRLMTVNARQLIMEKLEVLQAQSLDVAAPSSRPTCSCC